MKLAQNIKFGAWVLIILNLVMAFGSIWVFARMAPAIEIIIERNQKSLIASEEMLTILVMTTTATQDTSKAKAEFAKSLKRAQNNITETEEPAAIEAIRKNYPKAFAGDSQGMKKTVSAIQHFNQINRDAMLNADRQARQLGNAGAWGIVFMASTVFMAGMLFIRSLKRGMMKPLEEIHSVVKAVKNGNRVRRCTVADSPKDIRVIFDGLNDMLDQNTQHEMNQKKWV